MVKCFSSKATKKFFKKVCNDKRQETIFYGIGLDVQRRQFVVLSGSFAQPCPVLTGNFMLPGNTMHRNPMLHITARKVLEPFPLSFRCINTKSSTKTSEKIETVANSSSFRDRRHCRQKRPAGITNLNFFLTVEKWKR